MTSVVRRREHDDSGEYSDASQDIEHNNSGHVSTGSSHNSVNFRFGAKKYYGLLSLGRSRDGMSISFSYIEVTNWAPLTETPPMCLDFNFRNFAAT